MSGVEGADGAGECVVPAGAPGTGGGLKPYNEHLISIMHKRDENFDSPIAFRPQRCLP